MGARRRDAMKKVRRVRPTPKPREEVPLPRAPAEVIGVKHRARGL